MSDTEGPLAGSSINAEGPLAGSSINAVGAAPGNEFSGNEQRAVFSERLYLPWWGWLLPLVAGAVLAAEIHMGYPGVRSWLPYVIMLPLVTAMIIWLGRVRVAVADGELWVADAHLPLRFIGGVEVLSAKDKRRALGRDLDPMAYVMHRGWVGPVLRVQLTDPDDPTPYWLFSVRKADRLAHLLRQEG